MWPTDAEELRTRQEQLAADDMGPLWEPSEATTVLGGCWVCFPRGQTGPGDAGDLAWSAAVVMRGRVLHRRVVEGRAGAPYVPGLLALRIGPLLERAVRSLPPEPDVLLVDATGRDHPRRCGLALHLGAELGIPTIGITHRPLLAEGEWPPDQRGATSPLRLGGEVEAAFLRTRPGSRPIVVHPGWRVDLETALGVVAGSAVRRTPEPVRRARQAARLARDAAD